jgi:hypothetical protein
VSPWVAVFEAIPPQRQPDMMSFSITCRSKFGRSTAGILRSPVAMNALQDFSVNLNGLL